MPGRCFIGHEDIPPEIREQLEFVDAEARARTEARIQEMMGGLRERAKADLGIEDAFQQLEDRLRGR